MKNILEKLSEAVHNFKDVQDKLRAYGASDTEPDWVFQNEILRAVAGKPYEPLTANFWQLYTVSRKCDGAAKRLNVALSKVLNVIATAPASDKRVIEAWANQFCWRLQD